MPDLPLCLRQPAEGLAWSRLRTCLLNDLVDVACPADSAESFLELPILSG